MPELPLRPCRRHCWRERSLPVPAARPSLSPRPARLQAAEQLRPLWRADHDTQPEAYPEYAEEWARLLSIFSSCCRLLPAAPLAPGSPCCSGGGALRSGTPDLPATPAAAADAPEAMQVD